MTRRSCFWIHPCRYAGRLSVYLRGWLGQHTALCPRYCHRSGSVDTAKVVGTAAAAVDMVQLMEVMGKSQPLGSAHPWLVNHKLLLNLSRFISDMYFTTFLHEARKTSIRYNWLCFTSHAERSLAWHDRHLSLPLKLLTCMSRAYDSICGFHSCIGLTLRHAGRHLQTCHVRPRLLAQKELPPSWMGLQCL